MQKEKRLIPELRFSEFDGDWDRKKAENLFRYQQGVQCAVEEQYLLWEKGLVRFIRIVDLTKNDEPVRYILNPGDIHQISKDDLFMVRYGNAGLIAFGYEGVVANNLFRIIPKSNNTYNVFFYYNFYKLQRRLEVLASSSTMPALNFSSLNTLELCFPKFKEQQKIANFLTSIDTQIQTLEKKKTLLEQYKKGVMQKIFKQELRFKNDDGKAFPNWEFVKLKEVLKRSKLKNTDEKVKYVLTNSATQGIVSQNEYFDKEIANQNNLQGYYVVEKDDFIYNPRISQSAPVGPLKRNKLALGVMSPLYTVLRPKKGNLDFFEFYFETTLWHKYMKAIANYGARHDRMNITMVDFENLPIPYPSLKEQIKIANFLSAIDKNIDLVTTKIEHTKSYKKGLLQQMFV